MDEPELPEKAKVSRFASAIRGLMRLGMWLLLLAFLFSFFGQQFFIAELLANFRTHFGLMFLVSLIATRFVKASWLLFICLFFAAAFSVWETGRLFLPGEQPAAGATKIRLMSFNVLATSGDFDSAISEIREHDPDIVAVLEYAGMWHVALDALNETYPHQHRDPRWHGYGIAVFSKLPLENAESIHLTAPEIDNPAVSANIQVGGQSLRIFAVHVMSPIRKFRLELRNRQFKEIATHINAQSTPTMLVGDMNCSTSSGFLSGLIEEANLRDSRQGFGVHPSWPSIAGPLAVPIDHVLVTNEIHVHNRFLGDAGASDHRPVIVDVSISPR